MFPRFVGFWRKAQWFWLLLLAILCALPFSAAHADSPVLTHVQTLVGFAGVAPDLQANGLAYTSGLAWSPDRNFVYLTDSNSNAVLTLRRNPTDGALIHVATNSHYNFSTPTDVVISPDGLHVYVMNHETRDDSNVIIFQRDFSDGRLTLIGEVWPNSPNSNDIAISPDGRHLYLATEGEFNIYQRNSATGKLTLVSTASASYEAIASSADGKFVYLAGLQQLLVMARDPLAGTLTLVAGYQNGASGVEGICTYHCDLAISTDGLSLYIAGDSKMLAIFQRTPATGKLTLVEAEKSGLSGTNWEVKGSDLQLSEDGTALYLAGKEFLFNDLGQTLATKSLLMQFRRDTNTGALDFVQSYRPETAGLSGLRGVNRMLITADGAQFYAAGATLLRFGRDISNGTLTLRGEQKFAHERIGEWGPSTATVSPDGKNIYLTTNGEEYARNGADDSVTVLERNPTTGGVNVLQVLRGWNCLYSAFACSVNSQFPTNTAISPDGKNVYVTHYWNGLAVYQRDSRGLLTLVELKDYGSVAQQSLFYFWKAVVSPDNKYLYVTAGKRDSTTGQLNPAILVFARNPTTGALTISQTKTFVLPGATQSGGASTLAISPDGKHLYAISGKALATFTRNLTSGSLSLVEILQEGVNGVTGLADPWLVAVSPDGKNVYSTNYYADRLTMFTRNSSTGKLTLLPTQDNGGSSLWRIGTFVISKDGSKVYVTGSVLLNNDPEKPQTVSAVAVYSRSTVDGKLTWLGMQVDNDRAVTELCGAWGSALSPDDQHFYALSSCDDALTVFARPDAPPYLGHIYGRVTNWDGAPVEDVLVTAYSDPDHDGIWSIAGYGGTDPSINGVKSNGLYAVAGLPPGEYRLHFAQENWQPTTLPEFHLDAASLAAATPVIIPSAAAAVEVNSQLSRRGGEIHGVVTNLVTGQPIPNVQVKAFGQTTNGDWHEVAGKFTYTDANGAYIITVTEPGLYRLYFNHLWNYRTDYIAEFYDNALDLEDATDIEIVSYTIVTGIDVKLSPPASIQGTVSSLNGEPLNTIVLLDLYQDRDHNSVWEVVNTVSMDWLGNYRFDGLERGIYRLGLRVMQGNVWRDEFHNNMLTLPEATNIVLDDAAKLTINAKLSTNDGFILAEGDALALNPGATTQVLLSGDNSLLGNDEGPPSTPLTAAVVSNPHYGTLALQPNGTFVYTHDGGAVTSDFFTYRASDGINQSNVATVTITINAANPTPTVPTVTPVVAPTSNPIPTATLVTPVVTPPINPPPTATPVASPSVPTVTPAPTATPPAPIVVPTVDPISTTTPVAPTDPPVSPTVVPPAPQPTESPLNPVVSFVFSKTVGIEGIPPRCTTQGMIQTPVGTTIAYCYTLRNTGNVTLTTHTLVDSHIGVILNGETILLPPDMSYSKIVNQALTVNTTNIATWTATIDSGALGADVGAAAVGSAASTTAATVIISSPTDDQDQDTIPDNSEGALDADHDNIPNFLDQDADGDSLPDQVEAGGDGTHPQDQDNDGLPDFLDAQAGAAPPTKLFLTIVQR